MHDVGDLCPISYMMSLKAFVSLSHVVQRALSKHSVHSNIIRTSSSPRSFPIIWGRRNGVEYLSSALSCPIRPPPLTQHFPRISFNLHTSISTWFSFFFIRLVSGTGASTILPRTSPSSPLLTCPYHFSLLCPLLRHCCHF